MRGGWCKCHRQWHRQVGGGIISNAVVVSGDNCRTGNSLIPRCKVRESEVAQSCDDTITCVILSRVVELVRIDRSMAYVTAVDNPDEVEAYLHSKVP